MNLLSRFDSIRYCSMWRCSVLTALYHCLEIFRNVAAPLRDSSVSVMPESVFPERRLNNAQPQDRDRISSFTGRDNLRSVEDEDVLGPDTPGTRPSVPRLKRVLEDGMGFTENKVSLFDSNKRMKLFEDRICGEKKQVNEGTKFEWLEPSRIRDANRRRPDDPLYDRKTLYIPTDVFKKMSASQKQYWSVKSEYMDVVLFFKVVSESQSSAEFISLMRLVVLDLHSSCSSQGKFYELYEVDAELGHKELDWKMTMSGVGKCRQVYWWKQLACLIHCCH